MQSLYKLNLDSLRDADNYHISNSLFKQVGYFQPCFNEHRQTNTFEKDNGPYPLDEFIYTCNTESAKIPHNLTSALEYIPKYLVIRHNPY